MKKKIIVVGKETTRSWTKKILRGKKIRQKIVRRNERKKYFFIILNGKA